MNNFFLGMAVVLESLFLFCQHFRKMVAAVAVVYFLNHSYKNRTNREKNPTKIHV